jgi:hypothetical protein
MTTEPEKKFAKAVAKAEPKLANAERIATEIALDPFSETLVRIARGGAYYVHSSSHDASGSDRGHPRDRWRAQ